MTPEMGLYPPHLDYVISLNSYSCWLVCVVDWYYILFNWLRSDKWYQSYAAEWSRVQEASLQANITIISFFSI